YKYLSCLHTLSLTSLHSLLQTLNLIISFIFFFSPLHPPPTSTLFPYTTLFRSLTINPLPVGGTQNEGDREREKAWKRFYAEAPLDRKSTRLNSSHLGISYAVFCLKKKKKKNKIYTQIKKKK